MSRSNDEIAQHRLFMEAHPLGLAFSELCAPLDPGPPEVEVVEYGDTHVYDPYIVSVVAEATGIDEDEVFTKGHYIELERVAGLSDSDLLRFNHATHIMGDVFYHVEKTPRFAVIRKIENSAWRWGYHRMSWHEVCAYFNAIRGFDFGLPDFTVTLDHTAGSNQFGTTVYTHEMKIVNGWDDKPQMVRTLYADGSLSLLIAYKGKHVLTISISPSAQGLLINQIQLRHKRGNRFLYKHNLHDRYFEYAIERVSQAFEGSGIPILLSDGSSLARFVHGNHGNSLPEDWEVIAARIAATYDQPLISFERGESAMFKYDTFQGLHSHEVTLRQLIPVAI